MSQLIKILGSSTTALTSGVSSLNFRELAVTNISGVTRFYVGDSSNLAREIAGAAYALLASPAFTGTPTAPTASSGTNTTQIATTEFVTSAIAAAIAGGVTYIGAIDCSANPNYPAASKGDLYVVSVAGKIGGASGEAVQAGDFILCNTDNAGGDQASVGADFDIVQGNIDINALAGVGLAVNGAALDVQFDNSTIGINGSNQLYVKPEGITATEIATSAIGSGLNGGDGTALSVRVDGSSIEINGSDLLAIKALGVTNEMLAGSIADSKLNTITTANKVSGSAVQLASGSAIENNTGLDVSVDGASIINNAGTLEVATIDGGTF